MTDMGNPNYRTFDPAKEAGAEPPQPRGNSLRDRIRRSEQGAGNGSAPVQSRSGYVHNPRGGCEVYLASHDARP